MAVGGWYFGVIVFLLLRLCASAAEAGTDDSGHPSWFPNRPIEIIVPFARGGGMDVSSRLLAKYAEKMTGERIVVVNNTAGGNIRGNTEAIQAAPDGYVLGAWGTGLVTDSMVIRAAPYTHKDVQPVCMYALDPHLVVVGRRFAERAGIASLGDLVEYARRNPNRVTFGIGGNWTSHDFVRGLLEEEAGVNFVRMPFLGGAPAGRAAAEGNCDVVSLFLAEYLALPTERLLPLAVTHDTRLSALPDCPTTAEEGFPGTKRQIWRVLTLPKGTPIPIVQFLESVFRRVVENPDFVAEAREAGLNPFFMGAAELEGFLDAEYARYRELTKKWGIHVDR